MAALSDDEAYSLVLLLLKMPHRAVRFGAVYALLAFRDTPKRGDAKDRLRGLSVDADHDVRSAAKLILGAFAHGTVK